MLFSKGHVAPQAHVDVPAGTVEEEYAREGFAGRYAHIYRTAPLLGWSRIEGELRPHAFNADELAGLGGDYTASRVASLTNADCTLRHAWLDEAMPYAFRNADGDEVLFVHRGGGRIETDFGPLTYEKGDYLVIPRGTVYRLFPGEPTRLFIVETAGQIELPDRGLLGQHALFDPSVIRTPEPPTTPVPANDHPAAVMPHPDGQEWELRVQQGGTFTSFFYTFNPLNTVGWKGDLTVWQLNVRDIRPVHSERYHLPPTAHCTFVTRNAVICTFLPRPLETGDPGAMKVPFYHANIDYDEVLFYHDGDFFSRPGLVPGMITYHPQGIHHGPAPKAIAEASAKERTDEIAVMVDTRNPLEMTEAAKAIENPDYWKAWMTPELREHVDAREAAGNGNTATTATPQEATR